MTQIGHINPLEEITNRSDSKRTASPPAGSPLGGWSTPLRKEEFESFEGGVKRFEEALNWGYVTRNDRLRFLTLWRWVARFSSDDASKRPPGAYKIDNPGGFFTAALKKGNWLGTEADELKVKELLTRRRTGVEAEPDPFR